MSSSWPGITCCCNTGFVAWVCCLKKTYDQVCMTGHQEESCGPITYTTTTLSNQVITCDQTCSATELECMCQCSNDNPECPPARTICYKRNYTDLITGHEADPCDPSSWLPPCSGGYGGGGQGGTEGLDCSTGIGAWIPAVCTQWHVSGQVTYRPSEPCVELCASNSDLGSGGGFGCSDGSGTFGGGISRPPTGISDQYTSCEAVWTDEPCLPGTTLLGGVFSEILGGLFGWVPPEGYECDDGCEPKRPRCIKWGCGSCGPLQAGCGPEPEVPDPDDPVDPDDPPEDPCPPQEDCEPAPCCTPPPPRFCCCTTYINGPGGCLCLQGYDQHSCSQLPEGAVCNIDDEGSENPPGVGDTQCWTVSSCDECLNEPPVYNPCMGVLTYAICSASCCPCGILNPCDCPGNGCGVSYPPESGCDYTGQNFPVCNNGPCCNEYPAEYCDPGCPPGTVSFRKICGCQCQDCTTQAPLCAPGIWIRRRGLCSALGLPGAPDASTDPAFNPNYVSPEAEQARLDLLKHLELFGYGTSYITSIQL